MKESVYVKKLLKNAGVSRFLLTSRERKVLGRFLNATERVEGCAKTFYAGGRGILVATDMRLILLDSRLTSLYSRVIQYDRLSDVKFSRRFFDSVLTIRIDDRSVVFTSHSEAHLGRLSSYLRGKLLTLEAQEQSYDYLDFLDQSGFDFQKKVALPRHRHGKFTVSLQQ